MTSSWFFPAFLVFVLFGLYVWLLGNALCRSSPGVAGLFRKTWLGYAVLLGLLQISHLFWRIDHTFAAAFLMVTGLLAAGIHLGRTVLAGPSLGSLARKWPQLVPLTVIAFVAFLPVFNACTKPACHYDLGLYYLQEIRWMETFPIVPGLGNLILNLGFNQSAFLVTSLLDSLLPDRTGLWLVGGPLPWLGLTLSLYALLRVLGMRKSRRSPLEIAYALSLPAWIYTLLGNNISSGSPDVTSSCLLVHLFLLFAAFVLTKDRDERTRLFGDILIIGAASLSIKLNTLGMVFGIATVAILFLVLERDLSHAWRRNIVYAGISACILGFWVYRGVLLSGYPLFPSRVMAMPVAWRMEPRDADQCRADTIYWARIPYGDRTVALQGFGWVGPWLKRVLAEEIQFAWPIGIGLLGSVALSLLAWMEERLRRGCYYWLLLMAPFLLHTIFWITTAPEPRYYGSVAWLFAIIPILSLVAAEYSLAFASVVTNLYLCAVPMAGLIFETRWQWATPDPKFPEIPRSPMVEYTDESGLRYYMPVEGNQSFDSALPSANRWLRNIGLLHPEVGISGGFGPINDGQPIKLGERE